MAHDHRHHHADPAHHHGDDDAAALAEMIELDARVVPDYLPAVTAWVAAAIPTPGRILDVGCGPGTGALALARQFDRADVTAIDVSEPFLARLSHHAAGAGLADRITTTVVDLDAGWPPIAPVDLAWASNSLHHLADPGRTLAAIAASLRPGGRLVLTEMDESAPRLPRFLPDDRDPGLEERCQRALAHARTEELPHLGADWDVLLDRSGFTVTDRRTFDIDLAPPSGPAAGRYAQLTLGRIRSAVDGVVDPADLARLDALLAEDGPDSLRHRDDLRIRATRTVRIAQPR